MPTTKGKAMKHKIRELREVNLDIAAAIASGRSFTYLPAASSGGTDHILVADSEIEGAEPEIWTPRRSWSDFRPLLESHWPAIAGQLRAWLGERWSEAQELRGGEQLLCWFIRAYVGAQFGDEIELPD
jgi:hypothetical protein